MRHEKFAIAALAVLGFMAQGAGRLRAQACDECGEETYGTTIEWAGSPSEAAARAKTEQKLVFILHVSGHFEDPEFT